MSLALGEAMGDVLIDGRNRLAACRMAGVEPKFQEQDGALDDDQIKSLVLSLNNSRRHLSRGQKAMAVAIAYPDAATLKRGGSFLKKELDEISSGMLAKARKILRLGPQLTAKVMSGELPLAEAWYRLARGDATSAYSDLKFE